MADLTNTVQIYERHSDLKDLHLKKTILEIESIIDGLKLRKNHIMKVDISQIDFDIACHKKRISECKERLNRKKGE